ncbi:MAG: signal peptidase II [Candidatus Izemoplasmatales bacterium]|jgi:signal peptidase II|nr:signal peptidase II [Candidatus Izemoplasmatales bacterium]
MLLWIVLVALLVIIDQVSKYYMVFLLVAEQSTIPVIEGFFHFTYVRNPGVVFGIGGNSGLPLIFFIVTGILAIGIFSFFLYKTNFKDKKLFIYHLALALLIAGSLGNLIDRVVQVDHKVIDFLDFRGIWDFIFNFADMCLTVGMGIFVFDQFILEPKRRKTNENRDGSTV